MDCLDDTGLGAEREALDLELAEHLGDVDGVQGNDGAGHQVEALRLVGLILEMATADAAYALLCAEPSPRINEPV